MSDRKHSPLIHRHQTPTVSRFPVRADLDFYRAHQRLPSWADRIENRPTGGIDDCVNAHAGIRSTDGELAAHNLLAIVRSMRRRLNARKLMVELQCIAVDPGCVISPRRRAGFARKWAARMAEQSP